MNNIFQYQLLDTQLRKMEADLRATEERKRMNSINQRIKDTEKALFTMDSRAAEVISLITKAQQIFASHEMEIKEFSKQISSLENMEEAIYFNRKLQEVSNDMTKLENDIRVLMREVAEISNKYEKFSNDYPLAKKQYAEAKVDFERLVEGRKDEAAALKANMKLLEAALDTQMSDKYKKLISQGIFPPFVELGVGNRCGGCMMELPSGLISQLNTKSYIECENCRRIIVVNK